MPVSCMQPPSIKIMNFLVGVSYLPLVLYEGGNRSHYYFGTRQRTNQSMRARNTSVLKRIIFKLASALLVTVTVIAATTAFAQQESGEALNKAVSIDIPAGSLADAITALSIQTEVQILSAGNLVSGIETGELKGQHSVRAALEILIEGTGLAIQQTGSQALSLIAAGQPKGAAADMEEVVVVGVQIGYYDKDASSALKQSMSIMETPLSIFVINEELIADQQTFRLDQVLQNDSSVQKANNFLGAYSSYSVRGFSLQNTTNYLRDGRSFFHLAAPPTEILERVEVLKGPSSVLYGTLTPGGLINLMSKQTPADTTGSIKVTTGSYGFQHVHLDVGGSLNDSGSLRYRINIANEESESFRKFFNGEEFETDRDIYAIALAWDINDNTTLSLNFDDTDDDRPQDLGLIGMDGEILAGLEYDLIYNQPWSHYNSEVNNTFVKVDHAFNEDWKLVVGYSVQEFMRDRYDNYLDDFDPLTGNNNLVAGRRLNTRDYTTYYSDLTGVIDSNGVRHNLLAGFDQTDIERDDNEIPWPEAYVAFVGNIYGEAFPDPGIGIGNIKVGGEETRKGFYVQDMMEVGEQWRLLIGARSDNFETSIGDEYDLSNVTPRIGAVFLPKDNLSLYASYSESFEPNGLVGGGYVNAGESLDPTVGKMMELGLKWEAYGGNLLLTAALFDIDRDDNPIEDFVTNTIVQRGLQNHTGAEFSASGLVGENLSLIASATYLSAEIREDEDPALVGNTPFGVSEVSLSLWTEYQFSESVVRGLSLQGGIFYESERPVDDANSFDLDAYYRVDIGAKHVIDLDSGQSVITRLTVSNLLDEEYYKARSRSAINPERLREIRASIQFNFF